MVEIAIALGVIGFALVIIVGLLPQGLKVQKDNREDTIVGQDSAFLMEAISGGVMLTDYEVKQLDTKTTRTNYYFYGLDMLTNYVDWIRVENFDMKVTQTSTNFKSLSVNYHMVPPPTGKIGITNYDLTSGARILAYLSVPKYYTVTNNNGAVSNRVALVRAQMRAMSGSALEQGGSNRLVSFRYEVRPEILRYNNFSEDSTNYLAYTNGSPDCIERSNRWEQARFLTNNLYEVTLKYLWPVLPDGTVKTNMNSLTVRTMASGKLYTDSNNITLFQPSTYVTP
jgi:hypothetical protein